MNFVKKTSLFTALLFFVIAAIGCATPPSQTMVDVDLIGDRTVKYLLLDPGQSAEDALVEELTGVEQGQEFHFAVRICDIGEDRREVNCQDTIVLEKVGMNPDPEDTSKVDAQREVTSLFWYDPITLYVAYMERPPGSDLVYRPHQPKLTKCRIDAHNVLQCVEQTQVADLLQFTEQM